MSESRKRSTRNSTKELHESLNKESAKKSRSDLESSSEEFVNPNSSISTVSRKRLPRPPVDLSGFTEEQMNIISSGAKTLSANAKAQEDLNEAKKMEGDYNRKRDQSDKDKKSAEKTKAQDRRSRSRTRSKEKRTPRTSSISPSTSASECPTDAEDAEKDKKKKRDRGYDIYKRQIHTLNKDNWLKLENINVVDNSRNSNFCYGYYTALSGLNLRMIKDAQEDREKVIELEKNIISKLDSLGTTLSILQASLGTHENLLSEMDKRYKKLEDKFLTLNIPKKEDKPRTSINSSFNQSLRSDLSVGSRGSFTPTSGQQTTDESVEILMDDAKIFEKRGLEPKLATSLEKALKSNSPLAMKFRPDLYAVARGPYDLRKKNEAKKFKKILALLDQENKN